jgi:mxaJ protein
MLPATAMADGEPRPLGEILGPKLVVCADPANLPYSNKDLGGFENRIADVLAGDLGVKADQFWFAGHKTFLRRTLLEGNCDAVLALPQGLPAIVTTRPYFTSSFVAVTRADDSHQFTSFDDPWLGEARIGLQLVGNEGATTAPAFSLSARGFNEHITGFPMWAEEGAPEPPQGKIVDAVAKGDIDIAFVWGPFGGYFAKSHGGKLRVTPILGDPARPDVAFVFPMAVGVRKTDVDFRDRLQVALDRHQTEITAILEDFGVPLVATPEQAHVAATPAQDSPRN